MPDTKVHNSGDYITTVYTNIKPFIMDIVSEPRSSKNDEPSKSTRLLSKGNVRGKHKKKLGDVNKSQQFGHKESKEFLPENTREKKKFTCKECGRQISNSTVFEEHQKTHLGVKDFTCYECGKKFLLKKSLIRHQKTHLRQQSFGVKSIPVKKSRMKGKKL